MQKYFYSTPQQGECHLSTGVSLEGQQALCDPFPLRRCAKAIIQAELQRLSMGRTEYADTPAVVRSFKRMLNASGKVLSVSAYRRGKIEF